MTQCNSLNVKLSSLQLNKLNFAKKPNKTKQKNKTERFLRLSSNIIGNSDDKTNFSHELLLTNKEVANLYKSFANNSSTDIKLSKTQLPKMV